MILAFSIICISGIFLFTNKSNASKKGGTSKIAYWNFKDNTNKTNNIISLADTIINSECEISPGYIAPGTDGKFYIIINAEDSKVKIDYNVKIIREENTPSNLYFFYKDENKKYNTLTDLFNDIKFSGTFELKDKKVKVFEISWKWPFENIGDNGIIDNNKDIDDLNFAKSKKDFFFEIEISGEQSKK